MTRSILLFCALIGLSAVTTAQEIQVPVKAWLYAGSTRTFIFTFAADRTATDSVDSELGEFEIPSLPLPGDIFYVWTVAPTQEVIWLSPMDVREYKVGEPSMVEYDVHVNWSGGRLEFTWGTSALPSQIDSMYIVDGYTEFPDNIVSAKVVPGGKLTTDNPAFEQFKVLIWFNGTTTSVAESGPESRPTLYPNPADDHLSITGLSGAEQEVQIVTGQGHVVERIIVSDATCTVPVGHLAPGVYGARIIDLKGAQVLPFIRR